MRKIDALLLLMSSSDNKDKQKQVEHKSSTSEITLKENSTNQKDLANCDPVVLMKMK